MNWAAILDECLQQLGRGETIDGCLARYPSHAAELAPMLAAAVQLEPLAGYRLSQAQRIQAKVTLRQTLAAQGTRQAPHTARPWWALPLGGAHRLAMAVALVVCLLLVLSAGVVASSQPGQAIYALRVLAERVPALAHTSPAGRATAELAVAERRLADLDSYLVELGQVEKAALGALLAGQQAIVRNAQRLEESERFQVAQRLEAQAEALHQLAFRAADPPAALALREAAQEAHRVAWQLRWGETGPPGLPPPTGTPMPGHAEGGRGKPEDETPATATPTEASQPARTPSPPRPGPRPTVTPRPGPTTAPPSQGTPQPSRDLSPGITPPPGRPRPSDGPSATPPPRPRPGQTAIAQTVTAVAETATLVRPGGGPSATPPPRPRPGQTAIAQTVTAVAETATLVRPGGGPSATPPPRPRPGQTAIAQTVTAVTETATPVRPGGGPSATPSPRPRPGQTAIAQTAIAQTATAPTSVPATPTSNQPTASPGGTPPAGTRVRPAP